MEIYGSHEETGFCQICSTELVGVTGNDAYIFCCCKCGMGPQLREINLGCCQCGHAYRHNHSVYKEFGQQFFPKSGVNKTTNPYRSTLRQLVSSSINPFTAHAAEQDNLIKSSSDIGLSPTIFTHATDGTETASTFTMTESDHSDDQYWDFESDTSFSTYSQ